MDAPLAGFFNRSAPVADREGIQFEIPGEPVGKGRPRFVRSTGRAFTPERTRTYEAVVKDFAAQAMAGRQPFSGPLRLIIEAEYLPPASWSNKKKALASWKITKPDADNLAKCVCDSMNKVVFLDDAQVADVRISKTYAGVARLVVIVEPLS